MSPAKSASKPRNTLTIEFAGISTLVWDKKRSSAEVHLVDLASAGFERHYAGLSIEIAPSTPHGVKGPSAETSVSLPGRDTDVGVWNLAGTTVEILGATGKLSVDDGKADVTKKPGRQASSVRWLPNLGTLCEADTLNPLCPIAAIVRIPAGQITSTGAAASRKVVFSDGGVPVGPDRFCLPRFKAAVPFESELAIRLSRERILRFDTSMTVVISNTCVCGLGVGPVANHFFGHYDVVQAKRRPSVKRAGPQTKTPLFPELCWPAYFEI